MKRKLPKNSAKAAYWSSCLMCSFRLANVNSCKMEAMTTYAQGCQLMTIVDHPRLNAAAAAALGCRGRGLCDGLGTRRDTHRSGRRCSTMDTGIRFRVMGAIQLLGPAGWAPHVLREASLLVVCPSLPSTKNVALHDTTHHNFTRRRRLGSRMWVAAPFEPVLFCWPGTIKFRVLVLVRCVNSVVRAERGGPFSTVACGIAVTQSVTRTVKDLPTFFIIKTERKTIVENV